MNTMRLGCLSALFFLGMTSYAQADTPKGAKASVSSKASIKSKAKAKLKQSSGARFDLRIGGGAMLPWSHPDQAGNNFSLAMGATFGAFRVALGTGGVLPDSRAQGLFFNLWLEFEWRFTRSWHRLQPYLVAGLGVAFPDNAEEPRVGDPVPLRWSTSHEFLGMLGVGIRYGQDRGLYISLDFRAYNHTHGGFNLSAGYVF